jgi:SNF2 family DNA or RNA helicase
MLARNGALLMSLADSAPVLAVLPTAKLLHFKGHQLVAVKHTLEAAKVLRNLGLNAPSPLLYDGFTFSGRYTPMAHQVTTAEFLTLHRRCFCFNAMRTGKSSAALWATDYLKKRGFLKKILVICPLSVMNVWAKEAFGTTPHISVTSLIGKREKRIELLKSATEIAVINFDGVVTINEELLKWKPDLIIVDEASAYCNPQNKRYKKLKTLIQADTRLWLLTGTPAPNAPTDAYGLIKLVCPESIPASFRLFQETMMRPCGPYKWVPRLGATERVMELMQPAIRFTKEECLDLPPITYNERQCTMSHEQKRVFDAVKAKMRHEDEDVEISAGNAAVKLIKLQQIMCGVVKDDSGSAVFLNPKSRLEILDELIEGAEGKVIIFAPFKFAMQMIVNHLSAKHTVELVNGDVSKANRDDIFTRFQTSTDPQVLVAHPKVAAHGLDLSAADVIIWYAPIFSIEQYEQANARADGPNQTRPISIYHIYCHPVESQIYKVLQTKSSLQGQLLSLYSAAIA